MKFRSSGSIFRFFIGKRFCARSDNPQEILDFPWGLFLLLPISGQGLFTLVFVVNYFALQSSDRYDPGLMYIFLGGTLFFGVFFVIGVMGMRRRRKIRELLKQGVPMDQIRF